MSSVTSDFNDPLWESSRVLTLESANRHTVFIHFFKMACLFMAGILIAIMVYFVIDGPKSIVQQDTLEAEMVRMTNPRYTGLDADGAPYNLTADFALREIDSPNAVRLVNPVLGFSRLQGTDVSTMVAKEGLYDNIAQTLELYDDVVVQTDDGYRCETTHANIITQEKLVQGNARIQCTGEFGDVEGERYEIRDDYSRFIFLDNVKAMLLPAGKED